MHCLRCKEPTLEYMIVTFPNKSINVPTMSCTTCNLCIRIKLKDEWKNVEQALQSNEDKNGWVKVSTVEECIVHYILSKVMYEQYEPPETHKLESPFDLPDSADIVKILWFHGVAIGFYTIKLKGTLNEETGYTYEMTTLDTAYIRASWRRKGYGTSILKDLVHDHPNQDIGLSKPISTAMWNVVYKFLSKNIKYRLQFWELEAEGKEGYRTLAWYSFNSKQKLISIDKGKC